MRQATPADAAAMALAHVDSIRSLGPAFYAAHLVDGWSAVLGFSSHVPAGGDDGASVYVRGSAVRQGIGSALWRLAEAHAREQGAHAITLEASLPGIGFYRAQEFVEIEPCEVRLRSGVSMPCVRMRKQLTGTTAG